jgi:hypothetical protein
MTGSPAFSAAAKNRSAVPSVSQGSVWSLLKITRTPTIPGCSFHFGNWSSALGSWIATRPITRKRVG